MKTARELIEELNTLDEHVSIEAKTASELGESVMETVCAFANEPNLGGGHLILGVAAALDSFWPFYEAVGVDDADQLQSDIASRCASAFNIPVRPQISLEMIDGKKVIVVFVPEAGAHEKPIHFKNRPLPQSARRRIGPTDQKCTEDDMIVFYADRQTQTHDERILPDARLDDLDDEAVELYRQLRGDVDPSAEELKWEQNELLEALGAVKREGGVLKPTIAGVLLFGKPIALRRLFPMMRVDYIRIPGTQWVKDPDRRFDTVEIRSPLIRAIQRARSAVLDDLPKAFSLPAGELQGKELPMLPDRVVREVIANAVMHRDYRVHGSIQIIRYANRLEVRNPGYSIKSEERLGEPGSQTRNPKIAAVLHDVKFAESKGSGIRVMRELMAQNNLGAPTLESDRTDNSFLAILLFHHFLGEDDLRWLHSFEDVSLVETEMRAMISAREVGAINNATFRSLNRDSDTLSASKHLRKLVDCGLLTKKGSGAATYYVPTDKAMDHW
ncbi:MAG: ATP-binding protein, partial [Novipirellula sp. JB048]